MNKTRIDWCDASENPVMGCPNGCEYCYARKLNARFKWIEDWSKPQFFPEHLKEFYHKKPRSIFIDSMSDIGTWEQEWFNAVVKAIKDNPQHRYIALTKQLHSLSDKLNRTDYGVAQNLYVGASITTQLQANGTTLIQRFYGITPDFYSIEPILEPITIPAEEMPKLLIIGAETGNRKGKVIPQKKWIDYLVRQANEHHSSVFMKESLRQLMGDDFRQDKLPWDIER